MVLMFITVAPLVIDKVLIVNIGAKFSRKKYKCKSSSAIIDVILSLVAETN